MVSVAKRASPITATAENARVFDMRRMIGSKPERLQENFVSTVWLVWLSIVRHGQQRCFETALL